MTPWRIPWQIPLQVRFVSWSKTPLSHENPDDYPLVNIQKTMDRSTIFNGKNNYFYGHFPVRKLLVYQMMIPYFPICSEDNPESQLASQRSTSPLEARRWANGRGVFFFRRHGESVKKWCRKKPNIFPLYINVFTVFICVNGFLFIGLEIGVSLPVILLMVAKSCISW